MEDEGREKNKANFLRFFFSHKEKWRSSSGETWCRKSLIYRWKRSQHICKLLGRIQYKWSELMMLKREITVGAKSWGRRQEGLCSSMQMEHITFKTRTKLREAKRWRWLAYLVAGRQSSSPSLIFIFSVKCKERVTFENQEREGIPDI